MSNENKKSNEKEERKETNSLSPNYSLLRLRQ